MGDSLAWDFKGQPLVELQELQLTRKREPSASTQPTVYETAAGDPLFLHNVKSVEWDKKVLPVFNASTFVAEVTRLGCYTQVEDRFFLAIKNHRYMEHSLQPAYTAATFFLFQNGVVKDTVKLGHNRMSLNFEKNVQPIAVWASVPDPNAWTTLGGCIVVVLSLGVALLSSMRKGQEDSRSLWGVTEPHAIARIMLDEKQFPPMALHRRVVGGDVAETSVPRALDGFTIDGLSLQHQEDLERGRGPTGN
jgi:hypothetical protein